MQFGDFIVFEGIDGCGKSTMAERFHDYLCSQETDEHRYPVLTCEPYKNGFGAEIRSLLKRCDGQLSVKTELLLFEAARAQHMEDVVFPVINSGITVICDRFTDSTVAYQGYAMGANIGDIQTLNTIASGRLIPDIVFWIDADIATCMARSKKTDSKDMMPRTFYEKCTEYYRDAWLNHRDIGKKCWIRIDGDKPANEVLDQIIQSYNSWKQKN